MRGQTPRELALLAKGHAYALGFDLVGITALGPAETAPAFEAWVEAGRAGTMAYLERGAAKRHASAAAGDDARDRRRDGLRRQGGIGAGRAICAGRRLSRRDGVAAARAASPARGRRGSYRAREAVRRHGPAAGARSRAARG